MVNATASSRLSMKAIAIAVVGNYLLVKTLMMQGKKAVLDLTTCYKFKNHIHGSISNSWIKFQPLLFCNSSNLQGQEVIFPLWCFNIFGHIWSLYFKAHLLPINSFPNGNAMFKLFLFFFAFFQLRNTLFHGHMHGQTKKRHIS